MFFAFFVLCNIFEYPYVPHRGELASTWFRRVTRADVWLMLFLLFGVADATFSFWLFVRALGPKHSQWPEDTTKSEYAVKLKVNVGDCSASAPGSCAQQ
jgi:hypothetical protein